MARSIVRQHQPRKRGKAVPPPEAVASELQRERIMALIRLDPFATPSQICKKAGVNRLEWERLLREDAGLKAAWDEAMLERGDRIEQVLLEGAKKGDTALAKIALQRYRPEYGNKQDLSVTVENVSKMSDEELDALIERCGGEPKS